AAAAFTCFARLGIVRLLAVCRLCLGRFARSLVVTGRGLLLGGGGRGRRGAGCCGGRGYDGRGDTGVDLGGFARGGGRLFRLRGLVGLWRGVLRDGRLRLGGRLRVLALLARL